MQFVQLGSLTALVTPELSPQDAALTVVLLHGYGAPGTDLVGLAAELDPPAGTRFVFLQGPIVLDPSAPPAMAPRAWWPLDMMELHVLRSTKQYDVLATRQPEGLVEARSALAGALDALREKYEIPSEQLVLGGFSQGAMLSTDYALHASTDLGGLVVLSGSVLTENEWAPLFAAHRQVPVFQSHSPDDQVLAFVLAERLRDRFVAAGYSHEFVSFRGGHGIGPTVLSGLNRFLAARSD